MGDVIKFRRSVPRTRDNGRALCASGFHKWKALPERRFDVKQGKLVTVERCERCGKIRTRLR
jgi:hypothetical protein